MVWLRHATRVFAPYHSLCRVGFQHELKPGEFNSILLQMRRPSDALVTALVHSKKPLPAGVEQVCSPHGERCWQRRLTSAVHLCVCACMLRWPTASSAAGWYGCPARVRERHRPFGCCCCPYRQRGVPCGVRGPGGLPKPRACDSGHAVAATQPGRSTSHRRQRWAERRWCCRWLRWRHAQRVAQPRPFMLQPRNGATAHPEPSPLLCCSAPSARGGGHAAAFCARHRCWCWPRRGYGRRRWHWC